MGLTYQEENNSGTLTLDGDLTLSQAEELRMLLIKAIINVDKLFLALGDIGEIDLSCLQLLCSAHRSAIRMNKTIAFAGAWTEPFRKAIQQSGYARTVGCNLDCSGSCIWMAQ
jgi:ABC-type transporter Mla MlaB component